MIAVKHRQKRRRICNVTDGSNTEMKNMSVIYAGFELRESGPSTVINEVGTVYAGRIGKCVKRKREPVNCDTVRNKEEVSTRQDWDVVHFESQVGGPPKFR